MNLKDIKLAEGDGAMVFIRKKDGEIKILFPQLGLLSPGVLEQYQIHMYNELIKAQVLANQERM